MVDYFHNTFSMPVSTTNQVFSMSTYLVLTDNTNNAMTVDVTKEEVKAGMMSMSSYKALDPNEFQPFFYNKYLHLVKDDI